MAEDIDIINRIFKLPKSHFRQPSVALLHKIHKYLNLPSFSYPTIHVGGTNGKGSICHMLQTALSESGYKVGLFTSPHIFSFCERIQINNNKIFEEDLPELYQQVMSAYETFEVEPTFFEMAFFIAALYFSKQRVDIAIFEVGIGGRYDTTNIISPILSIITSIGLDHVDLLGPTVSDIEYQKAGIIKPNVPVVLGPSASGPYMVKEALDANAHFIAISDDPNIDHINRSIIKAGLKCIEDKFPCTRQAIEKASHLQVPFRFFHMQKQFEKKEIDIVFDTAHNLQAFEKLFFKLLQKFPQRPIYLVSGFSPDKDHMAIVNFIADKKAKIAFLSHKNPKLISCEFLLEKIRRDSQIIAHSFNPSKTHLSHLLQQVMQNNEVLVFAGSFYMFSELKPIFSFPFYN